MKAKRKIKPIIGKTAKGLSLYCPKCEQVVSNCGNTNGDYLECPFYKKHEYQVRIIFPDWDNSITYTLDKLTLEDAIEETKFLWYAHKRAIKQNKKLSKK